MSQLVEPDLEDDLEGALAAEVVAMDPVVTGYAFIVEGEAASQVLRACERLLGRRISGSNEGAEAASAMITLHVAARRLGLPLRRTTASHRAGLWRLAVDGDRRELVAALFAAAAANGEFAASPVASD
jgi:hypothetical protein